MAVRKEAPESLFAFVVVAARRARQLMAGAPPLVENPKSRQPTRIAEEELRKGLLEYEAPDSSGADDDKEGKRRA